MREPRPTVDSLCDSYSRGRFRRGGEVWAGAQLEELVGEPTTLLPGREGWGLLPNHDH